MSLIELAPTFKTVIGVDNNPTIARDCELNLERAGVQNYDIIAGDINDPALLETIKADIVLYDIPYWSEHGGKVNPQQQNPDLASLVRAIRTKITNNIVIYAPPHMTYRDISLSVGDCEFIEIWLGDKHDRNFVFLGPIATDIGQSKITL
jgi:hypothetical protein